MGDTVLWLWTYMCIWMAIPLWAYAMGRFPDAVSDESTLIEFLMNSYTKRGTFARPVHNFSKPVPVRFGLQLVQIMDLDEKNQVLKLNLWTHYEWVDEFLVWDPAEYGEVDSVHIPCNQIWTPDIKLYNYADVRLKEQRDALCIITNDGTVTWIPQGVYMSTCAVNVITFPFDKQECMLQFGSWTYDGFQLDLDLKDGETEMVTNDYFVVNNAWAVIETPAKRNKKVYACCPEPFYDLQFRIVFRRTASLYSYILILPCVLLTSLTLVLFWIPPESSTKMALGMTIFMAFFVLLLMFEKSLPSATDRVPILGTYYCLNMVLITASTFLNVFVVNVSFYGARAPVPRTLRKIMFKFFARILLMDNLVRPFLDADKKRLLPFATPRLEAMKGFDEAEAAEAAREAADKNPQWAEINLKMTDIRACLLVYKERTDDRDKKEKIGKEWKALALIFDRCFFTIYLVIIVSSLATVLPLLVFSE